MIDINLQKEIIKKQPCFANLTDSELSAFTELTFEKRVDKGGIIVNEGEAVDNIFFIISGEIDVKKAIDSNDPTKQKIVATLQPGHAIGLKETGFFSTTGLRTATLVAKTDVVLLRINIATFYGFALTFPNVKKGMMEFSKELLNKVY